MAVEQITDWPARLRAKVYTFFYGGNWAVPTANAIGAGANQVEAAFQAVLSLWSIDTITDDPTSPAYGVGRGVQLDRIGSLVGEQRGSATDDIYRYLLRAKITANKSSGTPVPMIATFLAMFGGAGAPLLIPGWIAEVTLRLVGVVTPPLLVAPAVQLLGFVTQGGTRSVLEWTTVAPEMTFTYDALGANQGWGNENDPSVGGRLGGSQEAT